MTKKIAYLLGAIAYGIVLNVYLKEPLLNSLNGLPKTLASGLYFVGLLPVFILIGISASIDTKTRDQQENANVYWLSRLWRGDVPLLTAFCGYNVLGAVFVLAVGQYLYFRLENASAILILLIGLVFVVFGLGYHIVSTVGTLRSSRHYLGSRILISIAKFGVIFSSVFILLGLIFTGLGINLFKQ